MTELDVANLGQVFTPDFIVERMLSLRRRHGTVLEPSCGDGAFLRRLGPKAVGLEIDGRFTGPNVRHLDFFALSLNEKFDTIIGNPPYVRYQDIRPDIRRRMPMALFDRRTNLYLAFIEKTVRHLSDGGELIFITPRDFLKATAARKLNEFLYEQGTITNFEDLGDAPVFPGFAPNCAIWRFGKGDFSRRTNGRLTFTCTAGQLAFIDADYPVSFADLFTVKVGAVSGADDVFASEEFGNEKFVCSTTHDDGKTRKMIYDVNHPALAPHHDRLIARGIRKFSEDNWWQWGRDYFHSAAPRLYVNCKTRHANPFFTHPCKAYDGSVLAVFPKAARADVKAMAADLNRVDWERLGFVCGGRFLFSQRSLENCRLPESFAKYLPKKKSPR